MWPREIEEVLATHPAVAEVGVAGMSDPIKGEVGPRLGGASSGRDARREQDLRDFCRERLAPYKVPARVEFRDDAAEDDGREGAAAGAEGRDQAAPIALTVTPAASRPARSLAASSAAPGVSPWTQIVSTSSGDGRAVDRVTTRFCHHPDRARDHDGGIVNDGVRPACATRSEPSGS